MNSIGRLILRFLVVPFGAVAAMCVAEMVVIVANWNRFLTILASDPHASDDMALTFLFVAPAFFLVLSVAAFMMLLPAAIGVVIAEALAIRSWIFHAANGAVSSWIGWSTLTDPRSDYQFYSQPTIIVAAGLAAGFTYWLIAGWSAGFWKPVFAPPSSSVPSSPTTPAA